MTHGEAIAAAWAEVLARYGPIPDGSNPRARWFAAHRQDFHDTCDRLRAGAAPPPMRQTLEMNA